MEKILNELPKRNFNYVTLAKLPEVLTMYYGLEMSYKEISQVTGLGQQTIGKLLKAYGRGPRKCPKNINGLKRFQMRLRPELIDKIREEYKLMRENGYTRKYTCDELGRLYRFKPELILNICEEIHIFKFNHN